VLKTTLAFATAHFEVDPDLPSYGASELVSFLLDTIEEMGQEPLQTLVGENWGASCELRVEGVSYDLMAVLIDANTEPPSWWVGISPTDTRCIFKRLFRPREVTNPPVVTELLEAAVRRIPGVQDVSWYDHDRDLPPTVF